MQRRTDFEKKNTIYGEGDAVKAGWLLLPGSWVPLEMVTGMKTEEDEGGRSDGEKIKKERGGPVCR